MNKQDIQNKINSVHSNSQYVRVSEEHPLELFIGRDEQGLPTLRFNGKFNPVKIVGSGFLEIKQVKTAFYNSLLFVFNSRDNISLFLSFCEDIINQTEKFAGGDGYTEIVNRYNLWRKMFYSSSKLLNENEIMGLIGELLFLKDDTFVKKGISNGLNGWSGPEPTHKDFSFGSDWFEIKSISSSKPSITISSIEQLDSDVDGVLVVYSFEKMSPSYDGIKLNDLVTNILSLLELEVDKDLFIEKLKQVGYSYNEVYDNYVYNLSSVYRYDVREGFPRIKADMLPLGIIRTRYDIVLSSIEKFRRHSND